MRYLAAFISLLMHVLIAVVMLNTAFSSFSGKLDHFDIELVSLQKKSVENKIKTEVIAKQKKIVVKQKPLEPKKINKKISKSKSSKKLLSPENPVKKVDPETPKLRKSVPKIHKSASDPAISKIQQFKTESSSKNAVVLRQGKGITVGNTTHVLKRGSESRSMDSIAGYGFDENDFRGHYETATGRQIVVIDAREEHGRLVLHDRKTGLIRKLKKAGYGDFIYTYGPSFDEDEPVVGSIVFLPGDEHWIHRFMWLPDDESAEYPVKGRVDAIKDTPEGDSHLFVPAEDGKFPAVILAKFGEEISDGQFSEVARHLCGRGVVVLIADNLSREAFQDAFTRLAGLKKVEVSRIGLWLRGYRAQKIPRIAMHAGRCGFVILTIDSPGENLYPERVASVVPDNVPTFIGFRNISVDWKVIVPVMLTGFQSAPHKLKILEEAPPVSDGVGTDLRWVDSLSGDFVSSISAWLDSQ